MNWQDYLEIDNNGNIFYKGVHVELSCENIMNLTIRGNIKEYLEKEVVEHIREIKIDIILSGR